MVPLVNYSKRAFTAQSSDAHGEWGEAKKLQPQQRDKNFPEKQDWRKSSPMMIKGRRNPDQRSRDKAGKG